MKLRVAMVAAVLFSGLTQARRADAHNCVKERPYCMDLRVLEQRPQRQVILSRQLGHHCAYDGLQEDPQSDKRELYSRIEVVFSQVSRTHGFLETITIYFEGKEQQVGGKVTAYQKRNDFNHYDGRPYGPGTSMSLRVGKRVEFGVYRGEKWSQYIIKHQSAAGGPVSGPVPPGAGGRTPPGGPGGQQPPYVDCQGDHDLLLSVRPAGS